MNWFKGNFAEAAAYSKAKNAIFVVYVAGNDEATQKLDNFFNEKKIREKLETDDFVAIKIESNSHSYTQFAAAYMHQVVPVPVPAIFFIGSSGTPLEIGTGTMTSSEEFASKINKVLTASGRDYSSVSNVAVEELSNQVVVESSTQPSTSNYLKKDISKPEQDVGEMVEDQDVADDVTISSTESRLKLEKQWRERIENEKQNEKERKLQRRHEGNKLPNLQEWQRELELQEAKETIRRAKIEEQAARDRVRVQIAADRAERAHKLKIIGETVTAKSAIPENKTVQESSAAPGSIRIQFRFPTGENSTHVFHCDDHFQLVRDYVRTSLLPATEIREFTLATTYPKREFSIEYDCQTLAELGFFRSAVLLIIIKDATAAPSTIVAHSSGLINMLGALAMTILSPVIAIFSYIRNITIGGAVQEVGNQPITAASTQGKNERSVREDVVRLRNLKRFGFNDEGAGASKRTQKKNQKKEPTKTHKRFGTSNIHGLDETRDDDSDDENNTWNGNSTQQQ